MHPSFRTISTLAHKLIGNMLDWHFPKAKLKLMSPVKKHRKKCFTHMNLLCDPNWAKSSWGFHNDEPYPQET